MALKVCGGLRGKRRPARPSIERVEVSSLGCLVGEERSCQSVDCFAQLSRVVEIRFARRSRHDKVSGGEPAGQVCGVTQPLHRCTVPIAESREQVERSVP